MLVQVARSGFPRGFGLLKRRHPHCHLPSHPASAPNQPTYTHASHRIETRPGPAATTLRLRLSATLSSSTPKLCTDKSVSERVRPEDLHHPRPDWPPPARRRVPPFARRETTRTRLQPHAISHSHPLQPSCGGDCMSCVHKYSRCSCCRQPHPQTQRPGYDRKQSLSETALTIKLDRDCLCSYCCSIAAQSRGAKNPKGGKLQPQKQFPNHKSNFSGTIWKSSCGGEGCNMHSCTYPLFKRWSVIIEKIPASDGED